MKQLVVTRHPALVDYLRETGVIHGDVEVVEHIDDPSILDGRDVVGVLPLHLAARAAYITVVPLNVPPDKRGKELSFDEVKEYAGEPKTFRVFESPLKQYMPYIDSILDAARVALKDGTGGVFAPFNKEQAFDAALAYLDRHATKGDPELGALAATVLAQVIAETVLRMQSSGGLKVFALEVGE